MRSITQREMRNQSSEVLRSVEAGESVIVTNNGRPVAVLSPYLAEQTPIERLRSLGQTRPPTGWLIEAASRIGISAVSPR